jgi:hypothetical protein
MKVHEDISFLVQEYEGLLNGSNALTSDEVEDVLIKQAEWTPQAAQELLYLAQRYGSFMLRNALAVSIALNIEDGECGL